MPGETPKAKPASPPSRLAPGVGGGIAQAALVIMAGNIGSRLLGMLRELVVAGLFGTSGATDSFVAASAIPTVIYDLLIGGAISSALIPVFSDYTQDEDGASLAQLGSAVLTLAFLVLAGLLLVLGTIAPLLARIVGAGFRPELQLQTGLLVRWMLPAVLFMGLSGVTTALLYSRERFALPAFAPAAYNLGLILMGLIFSRWLGVVSLVVGVLAGAILQLAIQLPGLKALPFRFAPRLHHPALPRIGKLYFPVAIGLVISGCGVFIDRNLASRTGEGNMAAMRFATALLQLPLGLVATALSYAVLPRLSRLASQALETKEGAADEAQYRATLVLGIKLAILAMLPALVGLTALRHPLIQLLYQHGRFDASGTLRTAQALLAYLPQLPFAAVDQLLIVAFYARKDTVTPVAVGIVGLGIYLAVALALLKPLGMPGLALANTIQNTLHCLILFTLLWRKLAGLGGFGLFRLGGKALVAASLMAIAIYGVGLAFPAGESLGRNALLVASAGATGIAIYLLGLGALKTEELRSLGGMLTLGLKRLHPGA